MRDGIDRLLDIQEAIKEIERYAVRGRDAFLQDELVQVWMVHHLRIIGEAAARLPPDLRSASPGVPWKQVIGLRNVLVHAYFRVDPEEVWAVVNRDIPALREEVAMLLSLLGGTDGAGQPTIPS
ncbi:MAG: hypothetical protein BWX50_01333 [Euryarchaeota archaeon ADurb.Bin009]|nr:MAG: hypothetical protein BWX50_01333 [Euryarchaeota archaeon ADurb.Bin009]HOI61300.1 DUF86 domain-containing protein [Methanoculleus sp.]HOS67708.1 DUF86 domain-containing protein [Methanoculleus sp.]HPK81142.1 DUF86 domain-containing protein [Methanoculleus sp.]